MIRLLFLAFCLAIAGRSARCDDRYVSPVLGELVAVPGGSFQRSASATNISAISPFLMSRTEITRTQYAAVSGKPAPVDVAFSMTQSDPVHLVSWYDTLVFCNQLSLQEGLTPVYSIGGTSNPAAWGQVPTRNTPQWNSVRADWSANGYRLPTEQEWRWAAMGADSATPGTVNTNGYQKPFAGASGTGTLLDHAWTQDNSNGRTNPAGMKRPNELGLMDMSGNVWEWCWDWYDKYPSGFVQDYRGPETGEYKVLAGGCFSMSPSHAAISFRYYYDPFYRLVNYGFRVVRQK